MIRSYKDERVRQKRKKKRDPSQDYLNNGFGGFSYQDEMLNYGKNESSKKKRGSSQEKVRREASSISGSRKVEKQLSKGTTGRVKHRARGKYRENRLKLDKALVDQEAVIRKSLQSEGYYRRHRQKARNNVSVPSSTSQSKTPKGGSMVRNKKKKKKRLPAFQHIPLSFMNTATPKPKAKKFKERSSGKSTSTHNNNKYFVVDDAMSSPNFNHKDDTKRSGSILNKDSSRIELDFYLVNGGTMQSTLKSTTEHRESIEISRKRKSRENQILRSYGNRDYSKASKISHKRSMSKKESNRVNVSRQNMEGTGGNEGASKVRSSIGKTNKFSRDSSEPAHHISDSFSGLKKHSNFMKPTKSTKNFTLMRNTSHGNQKKSRGAHYVRGSEKENHSDMVHLSPSLTHNSKISNSYSDYYKGNNKSKLMKHVSKLIALDEAEEFYLQNNSELYKHIKKNNQNVDHSNIRKKKRTSNGSRNMGYNVDYSAGRQKYSKSKKSSGLTLDLDHLDNPKMTNTHYPKSTTYLPPQHPSNSNGNFPNSTKNSKIKRNSRKTGDPSSHGKTPLCLLSLNRPDEYNREKRKKSSRKSGMKKSSKKTDYEDYSNCGGESFVELEDGTRNYNINEYQKSDSNERRKRRTRSKKKRKHKKGSSSYGGFGHFYEAYAEKSSTGHQRDRDFEKKFKKMKMMASREMSHPKSLKSKDNLLSFGGAQWK